MSNWTISSPPGAAKLGLPRPGRAFPLFTFPRLLRTTAFAPPFGKLPGAVLAHGGGAPAFTHADWADHDGEWMDRTVDFRMCFCHADLPMG